MSPSCVPSRVPSGPATIAQARSPIECADPPRSRSRHGINLQLLPQSRQGSINEVLPPNIVGAGGTGSRYTPMECDSASEKPDGMREHIRWKAIAQSRWNAIAQARSPMECDSTRVVTCAGPGAYGSETFSSRVEGDLAAQFCQRTTSRWQSWMRRGGLRWRTCASRPRAEGRRWGWQEVPNSRQSPTAVSGGHVPATPIFPEGHRIVYVLICMLRRQFTHAAAWVAFVATGPRPLPSTGASSRATPRRRFWCCRPPSRRAFFGATIL